MAYSLHSFYREYLDDDTFGAIWFFAKSDEGNGGLSRESKTSPLFDSEYIVCEVLKRSLSCEAIHFGERCHINTTSKTHWSTFDEIKNIKKHYE